MPSRKRNKGKARRAAKVGGGAANGQNHRQPPQAQPLSEEENALLKCMELNNISPEQMLSSNQILPSNQVTNCDHGSPQFSDGDICGVFVARFEKELNTAFDCSDSSADLHNATTSFTEFFLATLNGFDEWRDLPNKRRICSKLASLATDYLLKSHSLFIPMDGYVGKETFDKHSHMSFAIATSLLKVEYGTITAVEPASIARDLSTGGSRGITRFFSNKVPCDCLKARCSQLKKNPKIGVCLYCWARKELKEIMLCTGCRVVQYCSRECQVNHWPTHKAHCVAVAKGEKHVSRDMFGTFGK